MSKMPKPKYVCVDSWGVAVVGQTDYDALRVYTESADAEVERQKDAVSRFRGRAEAAEQSLASAEARIKEMTEIGVEVSREFIAAMKECGK